MAKRVTALETKAWDLAMEVGNIIPWMYFERPFKCRIGRAWVASHRGVFDAALALKDLGKLLRAKAGLPEPGRIEEGSSEPAKEAESQVVGEGDGGLDDRSEELEVHVGDAESGPQGGER